ncbi:ATP-binding protein [Pengzhenrongella frigida]|uniref:ATP-binding protein n=1 Tax=Pengzhenrongella frigida TaxID=1259133 RepID=A0A4V1ZGT7_9MICO|nr:ATP-binding protein [Cellulomonas sp. HLT2-17]
MVLMCGHAGSGKSTVAHRLEAEGYVLLSFDEEAWRRGYRNHPVAEEAGREVTEHLQRRLTELVTGGSRVVVDSSFWARAARDEYRDVLASLGVEPVVYYMSTSREVSLERLEGRRNTGPDDIVVPVDRAIAYIEGFEVPTAAEGAMRVLRTGSPSTTDQAPTV